MKQFVFVGLGNFSIKMIEQLAPYDCELMIIDKDTDLIEKYKNYVTSAYIADAINEELMVRLVPEYVDGAIIDVGKNIEVSILVCNYFSKIGIDKIIARAESDEHGEILELVGATDVIFPNSEAAKRTAPALVSDYLFNYMPISKNLAIAEIKLPKKYIDKTVQEISFRNKFSLNIIGVRKNVEQDYKFLELDYKIQEKDYLLIAGKEEDITKFTGENINTSKKNMIDRFKGLFTKQVPKEEL